MRADLPHGIQSAQMIHAAGESSPGNLPRHTFAVALCVPGEKELLALSHELTAAGIPHIRVVEDDPPYTDQLMAIGIVPMSRKTLRPILGGLKLLM